VKDYAHSDGMRLNSATGAYFRLSRSGTSRRIEIQGTALPIVKRSYCARILVCF
jgi:hypothetical protein